MLTVVGITVLASGLSPTVALVILLFIVGGIANGLAVVYNRSTVQRSTTPEERAGILALLMSVGGVMTALGAAVGGTHRQRGLAAGRVRGRRRDRARVGGRRPAHRCGGSGHDLRRYTVAPCRTHSPLRGSRSGTAGSARSTA